MNILILGSGGREHALAWKIRQSPLCHTLFVAPGNAGTVQVAQNVAIAATDFDAVAQFVTANQIELVVVGPEEPLVRGIRDYFESHEALRSVLIVGPGRAGAQLEGSKDFAKAFMQRYGIPTARSRTFTAETLADGLDYLETHSLPIVLKADGLAAGKGVIIAPERDEARRTLTDMLVGKKFGDASARVVIEEFLAGIELSVFVLTDGTDYVILPEAKDYKRIGEGDTGPNTGGMGAVSPVPFADDAFMRKVDERIIRPTIRGLQQETIPYVGFIFIGLMNVQGDPYVIEYNVRLGDPETQVVVPRIQSDILPLLIAAAQGVLRAVSYTADRRSAATVVLVSGGYPEAYEKGNVIHGLEQLHNVTAFHAGTRRTENGSIVTDGGRVLAITGVADTLPEAVQRASEAAQKVTWEGRYYRRDIGQDVRRAFANVK